MPTLIRNHNDGAALYHDLRAKHAGLAEQVQAREAAEAARIERARKALRGKP